MRTTHVKSARKHQGTCESCGQPIPQGSSYKWVKPRRKAKRKRHVGCPSWRPSELTTSNQLSIVYGGQEVAEAEVAAWDGYDTSDLRSILETMAEAINEAAEAYRESASNIEDGFGHPTSMSEELVEKAEALESWASDLESWDCPNGDEFEADDAIAEDIFIQYCIDIDVPDGSTKEQARENEDWDDSEYARQIADAIEDARLEWVEETREAANDAVQENPL